MILQECLDKLARGKLSNLAICTGGKVKDEHRQKVIDAINEALNRLHTILPLKEKSLIIEMTESRTEYPLTSEHSLRRETGSIYDSYDLYIRDTDFFPFEDDILNIIEVWDDLDRKRPINDPENPLSVFTPEHNTLNVNFLTSSFSSSCLNPSKTILPPMKPNRIKATHGMIHSICDKQTLPTKYPIKGIAPWNKPNINAIRTILFNFIFGSFKPFAIETAHASIAKPIPKKILVMITNSILLPLSAQNKTRLLANVLSLA